MFTIRLNKQNKTIKVVNRKENVRLEHTGKTGPQGIPGPQGEPGLGIPDGGTEGQVLQKASDVTGDFQWLSPTFSDKTHIQNFSVTNTVNVAHNLSKYPAITVVNSAGDEVEGDINYVDANHVVVTFSAPFSGQIYCN